MGIQLTSYRSHVNLTCAWYTQPIYERGPDENSPSRTGQYGVSWLQTFKWKQTTQKGPQSPAAPLFQW